ncbi:unnamed protein product [Ilex paraguariensis]|uniref:O-fucosyltransferase family protein n=1 Tax=Ilex paraguariensis TaxID=185542 RepID=A0ABC8RVW4_9AQUA
MMERESSNEDEDEENLIDQNERPDVFFADVEKEWVMQPGGPIAHKSKSLIEPSRLIMLTAQRFIQTFMGGNFIALHFRRHGFLKFCNAKSLSCFYPIPQAAACINQAVERANTPVIYLSTDAAESETDLSQSLVVLNGKIVPLVKRPARNSVAKWNALLYRHSLDGDPQSLVVLNGKIVPLVKRPARNSVAKWNALLYRHSLDGDPQEVVVLTIGAKNNEASATREVTITLGLYLSIHSTTGVAPI